MRSQENVERVSKRLLVLCPDAWRTGSPIVSLHLLEWLRANTDWRFSILLGHDGDLLPRFAEVGTTHVWETSNPRISVGRRLRDAAARRVLLNRLAREDVDAVYVCSAVAARLVPVVCRRVHAPLLFHVHELEYTLERYVRTSVFRAAQPFVTHYVAASSATRDNLIARHEVGPDDVTLVYECIPARRYRAEMRDLDSSEARRRLGLSADTFVVASCGTLHWRKGPDLFLQLGRALAERTTRPFALLWIGGPTQGEEYARFRHDAEHLRVAARLHLTGYVDDARRYIAAADAFVLTAREDPFPLACLEAGVLAKPVLCFEGAGGMTELLTADRGITIPYGDVGAMAIAVERLMEEPSIGASLGRNLADHVVAHHDVEVAGSLLRDVIETRLVSGARQVPPLSRR